MTTTRRTLGRRLVSAILLLLGLWLFDQTLMNGYFTLVVTKAPAAWVTKALSDNARRWAPPTRPGAQVRELAVSIDEDNAREQPRP